MPSVHIYMLSRGQNKYVYGNLIISNVSNHSVRGKPWKWITFHKIATVTVTELIYFVAACVSWASSYPCGDNSKLFNRLVNTLLCFISSPKADWYWCKIKHGNNEEYHAANNYTLVDTLRDMWPLLYQNKWWAEL